jgi:hypothetical protein
MLLDQLLVFHDQDRRVDHAELPGEADLAHLSKHDRRSPNGQ